jgi:2-iminobutanoate/2-iminopropanoate deaminase
MYIETEEFTAQGMPFSMGVQYGDMLYLSGQAGALVETGELVEGGIQAETRQTMRNIKSVLEANGSSLDQVIKCSCMLADIAEWGAMSEEYVKFFPNHKPARSTFGTTGLALGARLEIECMAYVEN